MVLVERDGLAYSAPFHFVHRRDNLAFYSFAVYLRTSESSMSPVHMTILRSNSIKQFKW